MLDPAYQSLRSKYPRGPFRALIGTDLQGIPIVLATDSPGLKWLASEISTGAEDLGLADVRDCPKPGLYVWEGQEDLENGSSWDEPYVPELCFPGAIRPARLEEIAELYALRPPEDPEDAGPDLEIEVV